MDVLGENEALQQFFDGETYIMSRCHFLLNIMTNYVSVQETDSCFELITTIRSFFNMCTKMFALLFLSNDQQSLVLLHQLFSQSVICCKNLNEQIQFWNSVQIKLSSGGLELAITTSPTLSSNL